MTVNDSCAVPFHLDRSRKPLESSEQSIPVADFVCATSSASSSSSRRYGAARQPRPQSPASSSSSSPPCNLGMSAMGGEFLSMVGFRHESVEGVERGQDVGSVVHLSEPPHPNQLDMSLKKVENKKSSD